MSSTSSSYLLFSPWVLSLVLRLHHLYVYCLESTPDGHSRDACKEANNHEFYAFLQMLLFRVFG
jgi:hypothetical protein